MKKQLTYKEVMITSLRKTYKNWEKIGEIKKIVKMDDEGVAVINNNGEAIEKSWLEIMSQIAYEHIRTQIKPQQ